MTDYWADLPRLRADGQRILHWIRRQGVVMCCDPTEQDRVKRYLLPVFRAVENEIRPFQLCAIYVYQQSDQPPSLRTASGISMRDVDGIAWKYVTRDLGELHAVGLSVEAITRGPEHCQFLFLHELAHIHGCKTHSAKFHRRLDLLIEQFNRRTGARIKNDYFGL